MINKVFNWFVSILVIVIVVLGIFLIGYYCYKNINKNDFEIQPVGNIMLKDKGITQSDHNISIFYLRKNNVDCFVSVLVFSDRIINSQMSCLK